MSRIDFILVSRSLLPNLNNVGFSPRVLSDQAPYWITLLLRSPPPSHMWRLNPSWLIVIPDLAGVRNEWEFFSVNRDSAPFEIVWDSFKFHARTVLSKRISRYKISSKWLLHHAEEHMVEMERVFQNNPFTDNAARVKMQARLVNNIHFEKAEQHIFYSKQRMYEHGEWAGQLLSYLAHLDHKPVTVVSLHTAFGQPISDPDLVAGEFRTFFASLYSPTTNHSPEDLTELLSTITFPSLTPAQVTLLEPPISTDNIEEAIAHLAPSKAPGSGGLPLEFYTCFCESIVPKLWELFTYIFKYASLPRSTVEALIVLIPKPGKDPMFPESCQPTSLLQLDIKILAKILALQLNTVILSLIHLNQIGFMPAKNTAFNLRRLFMNLQAKHDQVGSRVLVSLDVAKTFDFVEWDYLWECLYQFSFGPFINIIIIIPFRMYPTIRGLLVLYVDDMLLYLEDAGPSLQSVLSVIEQFGQYSGLKINWDQLG